MSGNISSSTALLTEHLRHTPVSLIDDVINSINTIGYKAVDWVEQGLLRTPLTNLGFSDPGDGKGEDIESQVRLEIENGVHQFETLLEATIDKNFDKMEIFALRSIIAIPEDLKDWIRLRHYEGLNLTPSLSPDAPTLESITLQRRKHQETLRLHRLLQAEAARNEVLIQQLTSLVSSIPHTSPSQILTKADLQDDAMPDAQDGSYPALAFLHQKRDLATTASNTTPLSTTTAFALSQLPAMKSLLAELRPALKTLSAPHQQQTPDLNLARREAEGGAAADKHVDSNTWREERLAYVESQTRRLHENVRGLELGPQGRVRDGEWQEGGRRMGRAEVEALEAVVGLVGGSGAGRNASGEEMND